MFLKNKTNRFSRFEIIKEKMKIMPNRLLKSKTFLDERTLLTEKNRLSPSPWFTLSTTPEDWQMTKTNKIK